MATEEKSIISRSGTRAELSTLDQLKPGQVGFCTDEKTILRRRRLTDSRPCELDYFETESSSDLVASVSLSNPSNLYRLFDYLYNGVGTVFLVTISENANEKRAVYMLYRNNLNDDATATLISQKGLVPEIYVSRAESEQLFGIYLVKFGSSANWNIRISNISGSTKPLAPNLDLIPGETFKTQTIGFEMAKLIGYEIQAGEHIPPQNLRIKRVTPCGVSATYKAKSVGDNPNTIGSTTLTPIDFADGDGTYETGTPKTMFSPIINCNFEKINVSSGSSVWIEVG